MKQPNIFNAFSSKQAITYRGNKRKILSRIYNVIVKHAPKSKTALDLFSGSGVVSGYLKYRGLQTDANDISTYSKIINKVNLCIAPEDIDENEVHEIFKEINKLDNPKNKKFYFFSEYYSENPGSSNERLFFTKRNGLFIDAVCEFVNNQNNDNIKNLILYDLLIKMSRHSNTNGVFNGFFKTWGGPNSNCLNRICKPIHLDVPDLITGLKGQAFCMDANTLLETSQKKYDVIYVDPPYNSHQYLSNYHILESVVKLPADRYIPSPKEIIGIDPNLYKSPYSRKSEAKTEISRLIKNCSHRGNLIIISYNETGHISLNEILKLAKHIGEVEVETFKINHYIGAGDRKSHKNKSLEYIISINCS